MRIKTIFLGSLILALLGFFFLAESYLPNFVENKITKELETGFQGEVIVKEVEVEASPALKLLLGRADRVYLELEDMTLGNFPISKMDLNVRGVELGFLSSGASDINLLERAQEVSGNLVILEEDLEQFIVSEGFLPVADPKISLQEGKVNLTGEASVLNANVQIGLIGSLVLADDQVILYKPEDLQVEGTGLPDIIKQTILASLGFQINLANLPVPFSFEEIEVKDGLIEVTLDSLNDS